MASASEASSDDPVAGDPPAAQPTAAFNAVNKPDLSRTPHDDPMDTTSPKSAPRALPILAQPRTDDVGGVGTAYARDRNQNGHSNAMAAPTSTGGPTKVVHTAFIHKLYNMLEDPSIQHLISWAPSGESFLMSTSAEFAKVLASYFKHTNPASFVRQLNMYGFHKVSDAFHGATSGPEYWEFRHGNGSFKRGDLASLKEIKRRASKQSPFIPRETFQGTPKATPALSGMPQEGSSESIEARMNMFEQTIYDMHGRLSRSEDVGHSLSIRCQNLSENLLRSLQWNLDLAGLLTQAMSDSNSSLQQDLSNMQKEIARQMDNLKNQDDYQEQSAINRYTQLRKPFDSSSPMSIHSAALDEPRRHSVTGLGTRPPPRQGMSSNLPTSPRAYATGAASPSALRAPPPPPPSAAAAAAAQQPIHQPHQHPLASAVSPPANLARRHTSADIRLQGWQVPQQSLPQPQTTTQPPFPSGGSSSSHWPSSPQRTPHLNPNEQTLHDTLSRFQFGSSGGGGGGGGSTTQRSPRATPPPPPLPPALPPPQHDGQSGPESAWAVPGSRWTFKGAGGGAGGYSALGEAFSSSGPPTRRSSMASNVHNLLNPAETAEREGEDEDEGPLGPGEDLRKRKRRV